jgi:hypothetical protein
MQDNWNVGMVIFNVDGTQVDIPLETQQLKLSPTPRCIFIAIMLSPAVSSKMCRSYVMYSSES